MWLVEPFERRELKQALIYNNFAGFHEQSYIEQCLDTEGLDKAISANNSETGTIALVILNSRVNSQNRYNASLHLMKIVES